MPPKKTDLLDLIIKETIAIVIASGVSVYVSTKILETRVTTLETTTRDVQGELKAIAASLNRLVGSFETYVEKESRK